MNKHITLLNLLKKIVSDENIRLIAETVGYQDSSRTFKLRALIDFFLLAAFISFIHRFLFGQFPLDWESEMAAALFEYA
ncbi:hypothetical protein HNQ34_003310 [Anoxybacillus tepidamans]|uniref:Transposase n=1 Tax=Anoxybacteroides tepidamans TaxID=265948 RepID=A0A7W8IUN2_9BACL|nr:hypothetical protein [Anoxybacillus tepidamans]